MTPRTWNPNGALTDEGDAPHSPVRSAAGADSCSAIASATEGAGGAGVGGSVDAFTLRAIVSDIAAPLAKDMSEAWRNAEMEKYTSVSGACWALAELVLRIDDVLGCGWGLAANRAAAVEPGGAKNSAEDLERPAQIGALTDGGEA